MTKELRKIIREQLLPVLSVISSIKRGRLIKEMGPEAATVDSEDAMLYDHNAGVNFASTLQQDIPAIQEYSFFQYMPLSESMEKWDFEFGANNGWNTIVTIKKKLKTNGTMWILQVGHAKNNTQEREVLTVNGTYKAMGYKNFIQSISNIYSSFIDPNSRAFGKTF